MTKEEVVHIRNYVKGAYPQVKDNSESTDAVWFDMLNDYAYLGILAAIKNYIKTGNSYPPTLADVVKGYELVLDKHQDDILNKMIMDGLFNDKEGTDSELADWNKENRINKARYWMSLEKWQWPTWFLNEYKKYLRNIIQIEYGGNKNVRLNDRRTATD